MDHDENKSPNRARGSPGAPPQKVVSNDTDRPKKASYEMKVEAIPVSRTHEVHPAGAVGSSTGRDMHRRVSHAEAKAPSPSFAPKPTPPASSGAPSAGETRPPQTLPMRWLSQATVSASAEGSCTRELCPLR